MEVSKIPSTTELLDNPEFKKALDNITGDKTPAAPESQPGTEAVPTGSSTEAASGTEPPGLPARVLQEEGAATVPDPAAEPEQGWIDQEMIDLASSYGISEERLRKFSSKGDFDVLAGFLDDQIRSSRSQPKDDPKRKVDPVGELEEPPPAAEPPPSTTPPAPPKQAPKQEIEQFDIEALRKEGYDENSLKLFEEVNKERRLRAEQEAKLAKLEQVASYVDNLRQQQEQEARRAQQAAIYQYHNEVDKMSEGRFGRAIDDHGRFAQITAEQRANRDRLYASADAIARNIQTSGRPLPPMNILLKRAEALEFSKELVAEESQKLKDGLRAQSAMRRPTGTPKAVQGLKLPGPGASHNENRDFILSSPEFNRLYSQLEAETGSR